MHHQYLPLVSQLMAVCVCVCVCVCSGGGGGGQCDWVQSARINVVAESEEGGSLSQNARPKHKHERQQQCAVHYQSQGSATLAACTRASYISSSSAETRACSDQDCPEVCGHTRVRVEPGTGPKRLTLDGRVEPRHAINAT